MMGQPCFGVPVLFRNSLGMLTMISNCAGTVYIYMQRKHARYLYVCYLTFSIFAAFSVP